MTPKPRPDDWVFGPGTSWRPTTSLSYHEFFGDHRWAVNGVAVANSDRWWGEMLQYARAVYGDQGIEIDEGDLPSDSRYIPSGRFLRYADGDHLPFDGRIAYSAKDATGKTVRYVQNSDGTLNRIDRMGLSTGDAIKPDRFTYSPDTGRIMAWKDDREVFSAPSGEFRLPDGAKQFRQMPDGTLVPIAPGENGGTANIPGVDLLRILPEFPEWFRSRYPEFVEEITELLVLLRASLGLGDPAQADKSPVKYGVERSNAGIQKYGDLKGSFDKLTAAYNQLIELMVAVVKDSADLTRRARNEVYNAIYRFNSTVAAIPPPVDRDDPAPAQAGRVIGAAAEAVGTAVTAVIKVVTTPREVGRFNEVAFIPGAPIAIAPATDRPGNRKQPVSWTPTVSDAAFMTAPAALDSLAGISRESWTGVVAKSGDVVKPPTALPPAAYGRGAVAFTKGMPFVGSVIGASLGTYNDVRVNGVNPGEAIVTNVAGVATGAWIGGALGSAIPVPVLGTAIGVAVGSGIALYVPKILQSIWHS